MTISVEITWLQEFIDKIDNKRDVEFALNRWIKKVLYYAEWEVKIVTPVDKWFLINSFRIIANKTWRLFNIRNYWVFVHEWTKFIKANPFMTDTVKRKKDKFNLIMNKELQKHLKILN